jgi:hypothetical protein
MLRLGRLGLRSFFEHRLACSTLRGVVVQRQVRKLLSPIVIVLCSSYPAAMILTFDDAFESVAKQLITRTVDAL